MLELKKIQQTRKIDLVEGGDFGGELFFYLLLAKTTAVKSVIKLHTPSVIIQEYNQEPKTIFYQVLGVIEKYCITHCDAVYSPTRAVAKLVEQKYSVKTQVVIPYPIQVLKPRAKIKRDGNLVIYAGKIQKKKGVYTLAQAVPLVIDKNPEVRFIFVGDDTLERGKSTKSSLINNLKKNRVDKFVEILDPIPQTKLYRLFRRAVITVIPSIWENFPNVLLEAVSYGSTVVASNVGGIKEIVRDNKEALLVRLHDPHALANAITTLLRSAKLRKRLSRNAAVTIKQKLSPAVICQQTIRFYERLLVTNIKG